MAKSGGSNQVKNLLRLSGIIFAFIGLYHVLRYHGVDLKIIELTRLGSLIYGTLIVALSAVCFLNSR